MGGRAGCVRAVLGPFAMSSSYMGRAQITRSAAIRALVLDSRGRAARCQSLLASRPWSRRIQLERRSTFGHRPFLRTACIGGMRAAVCEWT